MPFIPPVSARALRYGVVPTSPVNAPAYVPPTGMTGVPDWFWTWFFDFHGIAPGVDPQVAGAVFPMATGPTGTSLTTVTTSTAGTAI